MSVKAAIDRLLDEHGKDYDWLIAQLEPHDYLSEAGQAVVQDVSNLKQGIDYGASPQTGIFFCFALGLSGGEMRTFYEGSGLRVPETVLFGDKAGLRTKKEDVFDRHPGQIVRFMRGMRGEGVSTVAGALKNAKLAFSGALLSRFEARDSKVTLSSRFPEHTSRLNVIVKCLLIPQSMHEALYAPGAHPMPEEQLRMWNNPSHLGDKIRAGLIRNNKSRAGLKERMGECSQESLACLLGGKVVGSFTEHFDAAAEFVGCGDGEDVKQLEQLTLAAIPNQTRREAFAEARGIDVDSGMNKRQGNMSSKSTPVIDWVEASRRDRGGGRVGWLSR